MGEGEVKTVLIRHEGAEFERRLVAPWLCSFSELVGVVVIEDDFGRTCNHAKAEYRRSGVFGFADAGLFRLYDRFVLGSRQDRKVVSLVERGRSELPTGDDSDVPRLRVQSPNSAHARDFLASCDPDATIARCGVLLDRKVFSIPSLGTFVIHPGICPEYRNAHGCFWALAEGEPEMVGYTLLRIDEGIDTGPIYAQGGTEFDEAADGHRYVQHKVVADNLNEIRSALEAIAEGNATPIDTSGRESDIWGQPKLTSYLRWKLRARWERLGSTGGVALLYHDVVEPENAGTSGLTGNFASEYKLSLARFQSHLDSIKATQLPVQLITDREHPEGVMLTFDDGGASMYTDVLPRLEAMGVPGHFFVITGKVGDDGFLTADQLREISEAGHHVGSHTVSHPDLRELTRERRRHELTESKRTLESILDAPCRSLSIPGGSYDDAVLEDAFSAGYDYVFTSDPELSSGGDSTVGRWNIWAGTPSGEVRKLLLGDPSRRLKARLRWRLANVARRTVGEQRASDLRNAIARRTQ